MIAGRIEKPRALAKSRANFAALLCNLPQTPRNKTGKTLSDSSNQSPRQDRRGNFCYNAPVTSRTAWAPYISQESTRNPPAGSPRNAGKLCRNTPVTNGAFCRKPPVTNRPFCRKPPVTTAAQVVDYQRFIFLEILLKRVLESRPADSPARAGGPMPANRGLQGKTEKAGRIFHKEAAGTPRPAGPDSL